MDTPAISMGIAVVVALATIGTTAYTRAQARKLKSQLEQTSAYHLTAVSNQQNWELFDRREYLPRMLPSWDRLSHKGWAWRVLYLNHLNLLKLAKLEHERGLVSDHELESWILKAKFWFRNVWTESSDAEIQEGREILRQLLDPVEGYPKEFRIWLVTKKIISSNLIPD